MDKGTDPVGLIEPLSVLVDSRRYASDLLDKSHVTYTVPWWGPYKAEPINEPATTRVTGGQSLRA